VLAIAGMVATVAITQGTGAAWAKDYPSWSDVLNARNNEAAKQGEIAQVSALIKQNQDAVTSTQAVAVQKGADFQKAQEAYDEASFKADQLQQQADAARAKADESKKRAGQMAARLSRVGGNDVAATLFFDSAKASDLLATLGMASKITDQSEGVYARATQDRNASQSLTDQANVAKEALKALAAAAEQAMADAQTAADAAAAALQEQQDKSATLQAQLATLTSDKIHTEAEFNAGVQARAAAAAALKKQQEEAAAAARAAGAPSGGGPSVPASVSPSGWTNPLASRGITSNYGYRVSPCSGCTSFHEGVDLASSCGAYIFATHAGTVAYAGVYGGYGNYVRINHGDSIATAYGHIMDGGTLVRVGQQVSAGEAIAHVGSTGHSTGCHLHYEVRIDGAATNPVPFMAARGVSLG
jgi:murein DD-endopeptidase MepM/ murein hydrolase activator NlpD